MSHANAALTPRHRLKLARAVVEDGWSIATPRRCSTSSWPTAKRWADRYRQAGAGGDGRPQLAAAPLPAADPAAGGAQDRAPALEEAARPGADRRPARPARPRPCTRCCVRCRLNRLSHVDRATGEPIRRYEHDHPGSLLHVDVKKLGNIPDGGGWRYVGRAAGRARTGPPPPDKPRNKHHNPKIGTAFVHTVLDDHSRVAYAEIHDDETAATAIGVLRRAVAWFAARGVTVAAGALRQRLGLPLPRLARRLPRARHQAQADPALPAADQRQDRTLPPHPGRRLGLRAACSSASQPAARPCRPGCTSTTITGPTPRSDAAHPSPA